MKMQLKTLNKFVLLNIKTFLMLRMWTPPPMDFEGVDDIGDDGNDINGDDNGGTAPGTED